MLLRTGVPLLAEADELFRSDLYTEMVSFDREFVARHASILRSYVARWVPQPMHQWSRRWEYPYTAQRLMQFAAGADRPLTILDAGSGITFFPYYLCERLGRVQVICCDRTRRYGAAFERLAEATGDASVSFVPAALQSLPLESASVDAIYCVSVLEHTGGHAAALDEFCRVLRPGGLLVLTFDISLDGRTQIPVDAARGLLRDTLDRFDGDPDLDYLGELAKLDGPEELLTTDAVRRSDPSLLPWRWPLLKSTYDLLHGRGWTGGFFPLAFYCLDVRARGADKVAEQDELPEVQG